MRNTLLIATLFLLILTSCASVDLNAEMPVFDTGVDPNSWATIPAGEFFKGQFNETASTDAYEIMITDVTVSQYAEFLNSALKDGYIKINGTEIVGYYPGDEFHGFKHELPIEAGDWLFIPLDDPSQRISYDGATFTPQAGYENHPMTMVTWFGAWGYCGFYGYELPTEFEWEKAARGTDTRPFPWGDEIARNNANFYSSRDPFEDMSSFGSRTSPVGFYNGKTYDGYTTLNVWQWTGNVYENEHYRYMRGGSKDTYDKDLRIWMTNNATPTYFSPGVGFRCVK